MGGGSGGEGGCAMGKQSDIIAVVGDADGVSGKRLEFRGGEQKKTISSARGGERPARPRSAVGRVETAPHHEKVR